MADAERLATLITDIYDSAVEAVTWPRKGLPGDWRNHFSERDNAAFLEIAGPWLRRFGFA
jgi:hypothetical protein